MALDLRQAKSFNLIILLHCSQICNRLCKTNSNKIKREAKKQVTYSLHNIICMYVILFTNGLYQNPKYYTIQYKTGTIYFLHCILYVTSIYK